MRLTLKDRKEIEQIISQLTEQDQELIRGEVERIVEGEKSNTVSNHLAVWLTRHYDLQCIELGQDDCDAQELVAEFLWDYVTKIEQHNYALAIFREKHRNEAA